MGYNGQDFGQMKGRHMHHPGSTSHSYSEKSGFNFLKLNSGPAYLTNRDVCQHLEGHQVFENQGGDSHLQPDCCAVIYGPGKGPKEHLGKLSSKKSYAQANANPDIPGNALGLLEDLVNENRLKNSTIERGEGHWG